MVCYITYRITVHRKQILGWKRKAPHSKKLCVDVTLRSCNYCHYCTITMCTTIVAPRAQASNQVSFSSGEQTIKCFFIISIPFSLLYIHIFVSHPGFESDKKRKRNRRQFLIFLSNLEISRKNLFFFESFHFCRKGAIYLYTYCYDISSFKCFFFIFSFFLFICFFYILFLLLFYTFISLFLFFFNPS